MFSQEEQAREFMNVVQWWEIFDRCLIGPSVDPKWPGCFASFTTMAAAPEIPFLNIRSQSDVGPQYTNISSKDKIPWPFILESIGMRFLYPDPTVDSAAEHTAVMAATKIFQQYVCEHAIFEFWIREDIHLSLVPTMMPAGFGVTGYVAGNSTTNSWFSSTLNNGDPQGGNRWRFLDNLIKIPRECPIKGVLRFSEYGKDLLEQLDYVAPFDFLGETPFANMAMIEVTLRGKRGVQQRGEYHFV